MANDIAQYGKSTDVFPTPVAGQFLKRNDGGTAFEWAAAGGGGGSGGSGFSLETEFSGTASGTGLQTIASTTLETNDRIYKIEANVIGRDTVNNDGAGFLIWGTFKRVAGVVTQIGDTNIVTAEKDDATWGNATFNINGTAVEVEATGDGANATAWRAIGRVFDNVDSGSSLNVVSDTIGTDQNNYAPTGVGTADFLRIDGGVVNRTITGIVAPTVTKRLTVVNVGTTNTLIFTNEDVLSAVGNRFAVGGGLDVTLEINGVLTLWYDDTSSRWRVT